MAVTYQWEWVRSGSADGAKAASVKHTIGAADLGKAWTPVEMSSNALVCPSAAGVAVYGVVPSNAVANATNVPVIVSPDVFRVQVKAAVDLALGDLVVVETDGSVDALEAGELPAGIVVDYNPAAGGQAHIRAIFGGGVDYATFQAYLSAETDSAAGADRVGITPITALGAADTVQEALEAFDAKLAAETDSASGADYVAITPITALGAADTVQEALEAFDAKLAAETDSASGADYVAITPITGLGTAATDTVQEALEQMEADKLEGAVVSIFCSALDQIANNDLLLNGYTPGFAGTIKKLSFVTGIVPASTGGKDIDVTCLIGATATTGGVLTLLTADINAKGKVKDATAITALNTFTATDTISLKCVETAAAFAEGEGTFLIVLGRS